MNLSLIKEMANEAFHRMVAEGELVRAKTLLKLDLQDGVKSGKSLFTPAEHEKMNALIANSQ